MHAPNQEKPSLRDKIGLALIFGGAISFLGLMSFVTVYFVNGGIR